MDTADRWLKHYLSADDDPAEIWRFAGAIRALVEKTEQAGLLKVDGAPPLRVKWGNGGQPMEREVRLTDEEIKYIIDELEFGGPVNDKERALDASIMAKLEAARRLMWTTKP